MTKILRLAIVQRLYIAAWFSITAAACFAQDNSSISASLSPATREIPANTLRLYLHFSEPMRRGQVDTHIHLEDLEGQRRVNSFLNLGTELWNDDQTRLTLLFDPGRVKLGVGPHTRHGTPLHEGETVSLVVSQNMQSATGRSMDHPYRVNLSVIAAERTPVTPEHWEVHVPLSKTTDTLGITFERVMDIGAASRFIRIRNEKGKFLAGDVVCDGKVWQFKPTAQWVDEDYEIVIHPDIEDVAGNTLRAPFDTSFESNTHGTTPMSLRFKALMHPID